MIRGENFDSNPDKDNMDINMRGIARKLRQFSGSNYKCKKGNKGEIPISIG